MLFTLKKKQQVTFKESLKTQFKEELIDFHQPNLFSLMAVEKAKNS